MNRSRPDVLIKLLFVAFISAEFRHFFVKYLMRVLGIEDVRNFEMLVIFGKLYCSLKCKYICC